MKIKRFNENTDYSQLEKDIYKIIDNCVNLDIYGQCDDCECSINDQGLIDAAKDLVKYLTTNYPSISIELDAKKYNL